MKLPAERTAELLALARRLGHEFADLGLLDRALTHTSRAHEGGPQSRHNEPFEFLGDAVLGFMVADLLHRRDPEGDEGTKSRVRAHLVSEPSLARRAEALSLPDLLLLGRGEEKTGGRRKAALWADAYEAVLAALYLDGGIDATRRFIDQDFGAEVAAGPQEAIVDHKSALQELLQARGQGLPEYAVVEETGPSHRRRFRVECRIAGRAVSTGEGPSKKEAHQEAARRALERLRS
ncbi:MAG TPA: ribonuclease III [Vicinamibacteria bacterium]|nr:ribonuclease III [Vicinamibacteria bacterium]